MKCELSRRKALRACTFAVLAPGLLAPGKAWAQALRGAIESGIGGGIDATQEGLSPGAPDDQSDALAKALLKAELEGRPLFLPPGRYEVGETLLPNSTHIVGIPGRSRLVLLGGTALLKARHAERLRLEGLTLDGGGIPLGSPEAALLDAEDIAELVLDDCAVSESGGAGARLRACSGRVENSRFQSIATIGLLLDQSKGMRASGNVIEDCGNTGILVSRDEAGEDGTIVAQNRISRIRAQSGGTGQNGNGINLDKANGVIVADNRVDACAFSSIRCFSSDAITVTGNIATRSGEMALYVEFASEGAIVANNLIDGGNGGISFANFMEHGGRLATCSANIVRNIAGGPRYADGNAQIGAGISAEADVAISGNVVEDAIWGLKLGWGPYLRDVTATGNVIRRTKVGIAVSVVEGAGPAVIADNLIAGAEQGAILGMRWEDVATGELVDGGESWPQLSLEGNRAA